MLIAIIATSCACTNKQVDKRSLYPVDEDSLILVNLLETYGQRLDDTYNFSDDECEKGNWVMDVGGEMDWQDLIKYIIEMPDFEVCEWDTLIELTNGRIEEARCDLP